MRFPQIWGMIGLGRGPGFVAMSALVACSWVVGCGGESDDGDSGDDGGTAGTSAGKGGTGGGKGGTAGSTSGVGGTGKGGTGGGTAGGGTGGSAGTTGGTAGSAGDDAGGAAGEGGETGDAGDGNAGGESGRGAAGEGGSGGAPVADPTVRGKLIDFYGHPIPGVTVGIGTSEVVTNSQGEFVVEDAPETYDVSFVVQWSSLRTEIYGWVFQGLTRRDPTLQVFQGLNERSMNTNLRAQDGAPTETQNLALAIGSEHGSWQAQNIPENGRDFASFYWMGPATTAATAHGLMWSYDEDTELPTNYVSYTTFPFALDDGATTQTINISVAPTAITQANIGGTVSDVSEAQRTNYGFVRFTSGATLDLFEDGDGPASFSYLVPELPNGSVTFAALDEDFQTYEYAMVHRDGVAPGTTNLALALPAAASLIAPAHASTVDDTTAFQYQNRQSGVGAVVVRIEDSDYYQGIFVVTADTNFTLPTVLQGGHALRSGGVHFWTVEAHGTYASVDAMASPSGYANSFRMDWYRPQGPRTGNGTLTVSGRRYFTYEP